MIKSMTAFSSEETTRDNITVSVEIRCYNSRHLDLVIRLPSRCQNLEDTVRQQASSVIQRGRVEIRVGVKNEAVGGIGCNINEDLADAHYNALVALRNRYGLPDPVQLDHLLKINGIIEPAEPETDAATVREILEETLSRGLDAAERMREAEGRALAADIDERINRIEALLEQIETQTDGLLEQCRTRLEDRINELTRGMVDIDPGRIAQEAAFMADRSDISEEITRAKSHLDQFRKRMAADAPAGKPLNFLLQEFSREFNTMGSKVGNAAVSHVIVTVKTEIEKIREQVQNAE